MGGCGCARIVAGNAPRNALRAGGRPRTPRLVSQSERVSQCMHTDAKHAAEFISAAPSVERSSSVPGVARKPKYRQIESAARPGDRRRRMRCRCSKCEKRATFRGYPWNKRRIPQCECGARAWRVDWFRMLVETTRERCDCGAVHFPHSRRYCAKIAAHVYTSIEIDHQPGECIF